jgi:hypothetical protein
MRTPPHAARASLAPPQEEDEDEEAMGDVDLFALTPDGAGLTVNAKWLQHLQERLLGEDGHPRKVRARGQGGKWLAASGSLRPLAGRHAFAVPALPQPARPLSRCPQPSQRPQVRDGEDPHSMGLVLEWVYGSIVSTAEKGRDGAKRALGSHTPSAAAAFDSLVSALEDQAALEARRAAAKELLAEMLASRRAAAELAARFDISPTPAAAPAAADGGGDSAGDAAAAPPPGSELPDEVIVAMLKREALLTKAKLHALTWERGQKERELRTLRTQIKAVRQPGGGSLSPAPPVCCFAPPGVPAACPTPRAGPPFTCTLLTRSLSPPCLSAPQGRARAGAPQARAR